MWTRIEDARVPNAVELVLHFRPYSGFCPLGIPLAMVLETPR